ncbi:hypothetical protein PSTT_03974, partial [Puccinia striiformis]
MAQDTLTLLNWLGWDRDRSLHLIGISMGGMIAQELCLLIPKRFKSVAFMSTRCGSEMDWPSRDALNVIFRTTSKMATGDEGLDLYLDILFPKAYMETLAKEGTMLKSKLREKLRNCHELPREQSSMAFLGHFYAATMHHVTHKNLHRIAEDLQPAKILVITGDNDGLIPSKRSLELHANLPGSELVVMRSGGHTLIFQIPDELNSILERNIMEAQGVERSSLGVLFQTITKYATDKQDLEAKLDILFPKLCLETVAKEGPIIKSELQEEFRNYHYLPRKKSIIALLGHIYAVTMHHCPHEKLQKIEEDLKPAKTLVLTGDTHEFIVSKGSLELHENLPGSELLVVENGGHSPISSKRLRSERFTKPIVSSPELSTLPTSLNSETCVKKGLCPILEEHSSRPRHIYYEIHGDLEASQRVVLSINFSCSAWVAQVEHLSQKEDHAVLVFDNRGTGNSDAGAIEPYKTSEMAKDTLALMKWVGWEQERSIHLFGVSLGGMIAQELCLLIPERFKSVVFISTRCGSQLDCPSLKSCTSVLKTASGIATGDQALDLFLEILFPNGYFDEATEDRKIHKRDLRDRLRNCHHLPREQSPIAFIGHFYAAMMHQCSYEKLEKIAKDLHPAKTLVITGDSDELRSPELHQHLPGSELIVVKNGGHALAYQITQDFNSIMDRVIEESNLGFPQS